MTGDVADRNVKRGIIILGVVLTCLVGGWSAIWYGCGVGRILEGDVTAAFGHDLHDFVLSHEGSLPINWKEFETWQTKRDGRTRWRAAGSEERFVLLPPPYDIVDGIPRRISVNKPEMKGMETYINALIYNAHIELGMTNGLANGASENGAGTKEVR